MGKRRALCLNMIVKNEMANLDRCLRSVAPYIDCWVIGDTGSTDGTQDYIRAFFTERGIPGELHEFPFHDFAQARNEALDRARASKLKFDYVLLTDADMELVVEDETFAERLGASAYKVLQRSGVAYWNVRLVGRKVPSSYKGVTHEYLDIREGETLNLEGISYIDHATGSNRFEKYERDVRLLKGAIAEETDPGLIARYTFYLANTYRDAGQGDEAIEAYGERVRCGGWAEEVFVSQFNIARIKEEQGRPEDEVVAAYETAASAAPWRAEALHAAARYCRDKGRYAPGYDFAQRGLAVPYPKDSLFVQDWVYEYGLLDELGVNAYWVAEYDACVAACDRLLAEGKIPEAQRPRVENNRALALAKLAEAKAAAASDDPFLSKLRAARAREEVGGDAEEILAAYAEAAAAAPDRAEALHDAARFCRTQGMNERAWELAARGLALPIPEDAPGLERWVYEWGLQQEFSITAYYARESAIKNLGFATCNWLALNRRVPEGVRHLATSNLQYYVQPAKKLMPSFATRQVPFRAPEGYRSTNPSITRLGGELVLVQRTVDYVIEHGPTFDEYISPSGDRFHTRNYLLQLDEDLNPSSSTEILPPADFPAPRWDKVQGFEDIRPFAWRGGLWTVAGVRELSPEGHFQQVLARIDTERANECRLVDWRVLEPGQPQDHEKNWMPCVEGETLRFVYKCDPTRIVDEMGATLCESTPGGDLTLFRGGSQLVAFHGGWLALVHEARLRERRRRYRHRFVWFDRDLRLAKLSLPFFFQRNGVEFAAGLATHLDGQRLVITYGVDDAESWIATVEADDVGALLLDCTALPDAVGAAGRAATDQPFGSAPGMGQGAPDQAAWSGSSLQTDADGPSGADDRYFLSALRAARTREKLGGDAEAILAAYAEATEAAPHRAEALHDAARFCRSRGLNERAWELAARGLALPIPEGAPGLERWVYDWGLQQEFSIAANYALDPAIKDRGFAACDWLSLNRTVPDDVRHLATSNLHFYVQPARDLLPSFDARQVSFQAPDGYRATNPSIARLGEELVLVQRAVNYNIDHDVPDGEPGHYVTANDEPIHTRNFLLHLSDDFSVRKVEEILEPADMPEPVWPIAQGFEDLRPFAWRGGLWCVACVRELTPEGWCEIALARIEAPEDGERRLVDWRTLHPDGPRVHEKNWMPLVDGGELRLVYRCDSTRVLDADAKTIADSVPPIAADQFRGGSQFVRFDEGWLALVHDARLRDGRRHYRHRLVWLDAEMRLRRVSRPFYFQAR
ncbi:MAG TPA: glycosyltransferase, partial [Caulobacteraceae bacterium]|nr:glycosyltransferase [Caulobacteraceae bacterium]